MRDPWKLSLPQLAHPFTGRPVLVLSVTPFSTTHGEAVCFDLGGRVVHAVFPLADLERAPRVSLHEARDIRAASALIFDHQGRVLVSRGGHA